ncbi:ABC transporter substrate-binding protein [Streptomyces alfalfae]|jgi:oligopeptide transport system substrate-binding protein|uniref:ABC transporter substrate-binding protein n=1 Tax=Streptomyces alfalfae TaxID=1642299 RepID=A0A1P8TFY8_9ACTN|nr:MULTISPECIES: ABC transporter substrate-binding protein [Streptomyces]AYA16931.1 ABC transporter substrate-binding protein [Streptomyces fradiae]APY86543.1 peptide ABC transporter substrate-binding protein [Streptomyces alfalfae]KUL50177.1 peptide ABC transporter substrate-binding protein [Streptomyces sp. NRRL S-1521]QQC91198.1 ABC transporter substrate-binding protein [Streptomyces alfalfae]QUI33688.1 ABC transporter substrate-binding protein [Streptomyces alfalfae]
MRGAKSAKWVAIAGVVALGATACGGGGSDNGNSGKVDPKGIVSYANGEPQNALQPSNTMEAYGSVVIDALFTGLVHYDKQGNITYENAESVTPDKDSKVWTVKLKQGWKFHNGEAVTAKSYVDAWNWAADPANGQQNSSWYRDIVGYDDVHPAKGKAKKKAMSGLKVVDENTFTITLKNGIPYYAYKLVYKPFFPLPSAALKDPKKYGESPVGNGPYKFKSWDHKKSIQVTAWSDYKGEDKPKNGGINFKAYSKDTAAYADLKSDNVDTMPLVPNSEIANFKQDFGDRAIEQDFSAINTINPAFYTKQWKDIDVKVLQGLSMAIDRDTIAKTVFHGTRESATGWVAKGVKGWTKDACGEYCKFDPKKAKAAIKAGGGVPGNKISIQYNADQPHKDWVVAVCNSITKSTGVQCVGDPVTDFAADTEIRDQKKVKSIYRSGWVLDYPFNGNFLADLYGTGVDGNKGGFSDKKFDALTAKADKAKTIEESAKLYQEAEKELQNSFPGIPLWYNKTLSAHSNNVKNVEFDQAGDPILSEVQVFEK